MPNPSNVRRTIALGSAAGVVLAVLVAAPATAAARDCVGPAPGCSSSVQAAVDAASPGATIHIAPGTYAGEVSIPKSLTLAGSGADRTRIRGGGPVITVVSTASSRPTVTFTGLTIADGTNRGEGDGVAALGGGLYVRGVEDKPGGTAVLKHVVVEGNRTAPRATSTSPSGVPCPGGVDCPFALSRGGGIAAFGSLVLDHSVVRGNTAGGTASDANGGGVFLAHGTLTVSHSVVAGNRAEPKRIGRYAEGGGIFVDNGSGRTVIRDSAVSQNSSVLRSTLPVYATDKSGKRGERIDQLANAGGVFVGDGSEVTVERTAITRNRAAAFDPAGAVYAFDGGMLVGDAALTMRRTTISHNSVEVVAKAVADAGPSGTALDVDGAGTITDSEISHNTAIARGTESAQATNGFATANYSDHAARAVVVERTRIVGNTAKAISPHGTAEVFGAGVLSDARTTLRHVEVRDNHGVALAPKATAQGGGIYHGTVLTDPPVSLLLQGSKVVGNSVSAPGGTAQGGGVFVEKRDGVTLTVDRTVIAGNRPDQCSGCTG